jgi:hypothetical protein
LADEPGRHYLYNVALACYQVVETALTDLRGGPPLIISARRLRSVFHYDDVWSCGNGEQLICDFPAHG